MRNEIVHFARCPQKESNEIYLALNRIYVYVWFIYTIYSCISFVLFCFLFFLKDLFLCNICRIHNTYSTQYPLSHTHDPTPFPFHKHAGTSTRIELNSKTPTQRHRCEIDSSRGKLLWAVLFALPFKSKVVKNITIVRLAVCDFSVFVFGFFCLKIFSQSFLFCQAINMFNKGLFCPTSYFCCFVENKNNFTFAFLH